jgi:multisubunit Na+/H+ antiporter MnhB subunit
MFGKILLTAAVILGAYLVIRTRMQRSREAAAVPAAPAREPLVPAGTLKAVAYGLVVVMVAGSLLWLYLDYEAGREVVTVRIINANNGDVTTYMARRADVKGRRFTTLDGRPVTLSDVDRMELGTER